MIFFISVIFRWPSNFCLILQYEKYGFLVFLDQTFANNLDYASVAMQRSFYHVYDLLSMLSLKLSFVLIHDLCLRVLSAKYFTNFADFVWGCTAGQAAGPGNILSKLICCIHTIFSQFSTYISKGVKSSDNLKACWPILKPDLSTTRLKHIL